ncbi:MAG: hypothetical protein HKM06_08280 [Spirochaetales bacterium]|nr:hypothetical protein [Spirochaetales bacterium]
MSHRRFFWIIFLIFSSLALWGNGVQEDRIAKAKELIAQKNYNEAILLLTQVVKQEPDRLDQAQELLDQIRRARNRFNDDFERLLKVLYTEQDEGKALQIIKAMEATDKNPNSEMRQEIALAKRSAQLIYYQKRFNAIMKEGLAALNQKKYSQALQVYLTGYTVARDEFDESNYGNILRDRVLRALADLKAASQEFIQKSSQYSELMTQGTNVFRGTGQEVSAALPTLLQPLKELALLRKRIYDDSAVFMQENEAVKQSQPDLAGGDFFLSYAYLVSRGRPSSAEVEGVVGTIDRLWQSSLSSWLVLVRTRVDQIFTQATSDLDQGKWNAAIGNFKTANQLSGAGIQALSSWNWLAYPASDGSVSSAYLATLDKWVPEASFLTSRRLLSEEGESAAQAKLTELSILPAQIDQVSTLQTLRDQVASYKKNWDRFANLDLQNGEETQSLKLSGWKLFDSKSFWTAWQNRWKNFHRTTVALEASLVDREGQIQFQDYDQSYRALEKSTTEIQSLVEGVPPNTRNLSVVFRYPQQALQRLQQEKDVPAVLERDLRHFIDYFQAEPADVQTPAVAAWPGRGRDLLDRLLKLILLRSQLLETSQNNFAQAMGLRREAESLITRVQDQIANQDFQRARRLLNQASNRFSESLNLQEDAALRTSSDSETKRLFALILKGENELVIRDVRRLITQGSQAYLTGQFPQAEQLLLRAQARWNTTNTTNNPEIDYWLGLTRNALSINTGRVISPTDPLYNEIQQLLNFARNDYEKARLDLSLGQEAEAKILLTDAQTTLGKVLLPFPLNQEARVLNLRIQQRRDPEVFPTLFRDNFNTAVAKLNVKPQEAYNDLLDLKSIQPDYPGMDNAIHEARLILGIDRRPPNPEKLRESRNLTALAQRIYDQNNVGQFGLAIEQVNQALRLDPTNVAAQDLKDKLSVFNPSSAFMTPTQLNNFNSIVNLFASGRRLEAQSQLNQFLIRYPGLASDPRVKELQRRLQAAS